MFHKVESHNRKPDGQELGEGAVWSNCFFYSIALVTQFTKALQK